MFCKVVTQREILQCAQRSQFFQLPTSYVHICLHSQLLTLFIAQNALIQSFDIKASNFTTLANSQKFTFLTGRNGS